MSGSLTLWETWSASCAATGWSAYGADPASTSTRWTAQPAAGTKYATSTQTKGFSSGCAAGEVSVDMKAQLQAWSAGSAATVGLMLRADSETDPAGFKRFESTEGLHAPKLTWTANRAPLTMEKPTVPGAVPYTPSGTSTPFLYTANRKPTVSAVLSDPDGDTGSATFLASTSTAFTTIASSCTSPVVASAATASCALTTDLAADGRYYIRARSQDGNGAVSGYSTPVELRVAAVARRRRW